MIGELDKAGWEYLHAAQRAAIAASNQQLSLDYLLVALLEKDASGVVSQALRDCGVHPSQIRAAIGHVSSFSASELPAGNAIWSDAETREILNYSLAEATSREHLHVEPGHLLLAIVSDPTCSGHHLLLEVGVDLQRLYDRLDELLPTKTVDEAQLRRRSERFARLPAEQVRELTDQVSA